MIRHPSIRGEPIDDAAEITRLLRDSARGDDAARERVIALLYGELRRMAHLQRHKRGRHETLSTTALVNEAFLRLSGPTPPDWQDRIHFIRVAARAMRNVLVDDARRRFAARRGGGEAPLPLDQAGPIVELSTIKVEEVLAVDEAMARLEGIDERQARVVELRYFVGLEVGEIAEVLGISPATVKRDWTMARAWLQRELDGSS